MEVIKQRKEDVGRKPLPHFHYTDFLMKISKTSFYHFFYRKVELVQDHWKKEEQDMTKKYLLEAGDVELLPRDMWTQKPVNFVFQYFCKIQQINLF